MIRSTLGSESAAAAAARWRPATPVYAEGRGGFPVINRLLCDRTLQEYYPRTSRESGEGPVHWKQEGFPTWHGLLLSDPTEGDDSCVPGSSPRCRDVTRRTVTEMFSAVFVPDLKSCGGELGPGQRGNPGLSADHVRGVIEVSSRERFHRPSWKTLHVHDTALRPVSWRHMFELHSKPSNHPLIIHLQLGYHIYT